ncbi:MAG: hypothetical protein ABI548_10765 [Polyangiaceae bacterium]
MQVAAGRHWSAGSFSPGLSSSGRASGGENDGTVNAPTDRRDVPVRQKVYYATGKCTCPRLALLGAFASAAVHNDGQVSSGWLKDNSFRYGKLNA